MMVLCKFGFCVNVKNVNLGQRPQYVPDYFAENAQWRKAIQMQPVYYDDDDDDKVGGGFI